MNNGLNQGKAAADELLDKADNLEAVSGTLHGSAYFPVRIAVRMLRYLALKKTSIQPLDPDEIRTLISDLRKYSATVAQPAESRMLESAMILEKRI